MKRELPATRQLSLLRAVTGFRVLFPIIQIVALLQFVVAAYVLWSHGAPGAFGGDFIAYDGAARQVLAGGWTHLYDLADQFQFQRQMLANSGLPARRPVTIPFNYPPPAVLLFLPFAGLPARLAVTLWVLLNLLLVVATLGYLSRRLAMSGMGPATVRMPLLVACTSLPVVWGVLSGQPVGLMLGLATMTFLGVLDHRDATAGVSLGLLAVLKPQLVIAPALAMIVLRRPRAVLAFVATGFGLLGLTLVLVGLDGIQTYLHLLSRMDPIRGNPALAVQATMMVNWRAWLVRIPGLPNQPAFLLATALDVVTLLAGTWLCRCGRSARNLPIGYLALGAAGIVGSYHSHYQDLVTVLPPALYLLMAHMRAARTPPDDRLAEANWVGRRSLISPQTTTTYSLVLAAALIWLLPGIAWLAAGVFALGLLSVWTALAAPALLLVMVGAWRSTQEADSRVMPIRIDRPAAPRSNTSQRVAAR